MHTTETTRLSIRRYELSKRCVDTMAAFVRNAPTTDLYSIYRTEWVRQINRMYALYYAAFGKLHPSLF